MFKLIKRILTAATVVVAATVPSVAYARPILDPPGSFVTSAPAQTAIVPSVQRTTSSSPESFHWDDAGIGAASVLVLVLVSVGSGAVLVRQRRAHHPLTS